MSWHDFSLLEVGNYASQGEITYWCFLLSFVTVAKLMEIQLSTPQVFVQKTYFLFNEKKFEMLVVNNHTNINKRATVSQSNSLNTCKTMTNACRAPDTDMEPVLPHSISSVNYLCIALKYSINSVWFSHYKYNMYLLFCFQGSVKNITEDGILVSFKEE